MLSVNKILFKDTNEKSADSDIKIPIVAEWFIVFILSVNKILCAATLSVIKILCTDTVSVNKHFLILIGRGLRNKRLEYIQYFIVLYNNV